MDGMLRVAAAELGVEEDAPSGPLSASVPPQNGPAVPSATLSAHGDPDARTEIIHLIHDGNATTICCRRTPFELRRADGDRLTGNPDKATCPCRTERKADQA